MTGFDHIHPAHCEVVDQEAHTRAPPGLRPAALRDWVDQGWRASLLSRDLMVLGPGAANANVGAPPPAAGADDDDDDEAGAEEEAADEEEAEGNEGDEEEDEEEGSSEGEEGAGEGKSASGDAPANSESSDEEEEEEEDAGAMEADEVIAPGAPDEDVHMESPPSSQALAGPGLESSPLSAATATQAGEEHPAPPSTQVTPTKSPRTKKRARELLSPASPPPMAKRTHSTSTAASSSPSRLRGRP